MCSLVNTVSTNHTEDVHDAQLDYYGTRLATCSSDKKIKVFDVTNNQQKLLYDLDGHKSQVWQVAWSHPMYGSLLATCGYDHMVYVWKEQELVYEYKHGSSVNSISWAPADFGLILAAASSDGSISIHYFRSVGQWEVYEIKMAHTVACNAVSWASAVSAGSLLQRAANESGSLKRIVSGGCDHLVKIWVERSENLWELEHTLGSGSSAADGHTGWVRDVAWAPTIGLRDNVIASCAQDSTVIIWRQSNVDGASRQWRLDQRLEFTSTMWHVSWSPVGNILAASGASNVVTLWKENVDGKFEQINQVVQN